MLFIFIGIAITSWMTMARLVRGMVLSLKESDFVTAARATGASDVGIIWRHLAPNFLGPVIVAETLNIPTYILYEAFLSFIGLGVNAPMPSWGAMIDEGMAAMWRCGADEGLAMCPLINPKYLPALDLMCRRFPDTPVVVDHFARIGTDGQFRKADLDNLCGLARHKNVRVKVSAFSALGEKQSPYLDLVPMIRRVLDAFGPERLMWASDGPFQVMNGHTYKDSIDLVRRRLDFLTDDDRDWLLRKTAQRVFFS